MDTLDAKLAELADKLGVAVSDLWPLMVQKVVFDWWVGTGIILVLWVVALLFGRVVWKAIKNNESWLWDERFNDEPGALGVAGCCVGGVCTAMLAIITIIHMSTISTLFYPEIAAIQAITRLL